MALLKEESYTIEDINALPDGERAELIDGHIYYMAPPTYKHQKIVMELSASIRNYIKQHKGSCEVIPAPFAVHLDETSNTYVEPDISVICDKNKLDDNGCNNLQHLNGCTLVECFCSDSSYGSDGKENR